MDPRRSERQASRSGGESSPTVVDLDSKEVGRATACLSLVSIPPQCLVLDPGDELSAADGAADDAEASFVRAFTPTRSYQRLCRAGLDGLMTAIAERPAVLSGRIVVRPHAPTADGTAQYIVLDGVWHVAALRRLAEEHSSNGLQLSDEVVQLFDACPATLVHDSTDPALVLALIGEPAVTRPDPWLNGQRDRLLRHLARSGVFHSQQSIAAATGGDGHFVRRYHAYHALQQMMQHDDASGCDATEFYPLYPVFHAAVGRPVTRAWLDWDDTLCRFGDDEALEHFYRLLRPGVGADGTPRPPCIASVDDVIHLCDVLGEPAARRALLEGATTLAEAIEVINAGAHQELTTHVGEAIAAMRWERRRFHSNG